MSQPSPEYRQVSNVFYLITKVALYKSLGRQWIQGFQSSHNFYNRFARWIALFISPSVDAVAFNIESRRKAILAHLKLLKHLPEHLSYFSHALMVSDPYKRVNN
jgi:hypothetical protein